MRTKFQYRTWLGVSVVLIFALLAGLLALTPPQQVAAAQAAVEDLPEDALYVPGELVVAFPPGTSVRSTRAQATALAGGVGAQVDRTYANLALLTVDPEADVAALADQISAMATGIHVQPNYIYRIPKPVVSASLPATEARKEFIASGDAVEMPWQDLATMKQLVRKGGRVQSIPIVPNDGEHAWGWDTTQADFIWDEKAASPLVCLPDTGVDYRHPDLLGKVVKGPDFYNMDNEPEDSHGHGTHLAGIIAAKMNNGADTAVGTSNGKVLAVKVAGSNGWGNTYGIAAGVYYCANNKSVKIINLSLGSHHPDHLVYSTLDYAINVKGKLVVAAAGNDARSAIMDWAHANPDWRNHPAFYPAGWADMNVGWDNENFWNGWVAYNPDGNEDQADNSLYHGLISVGAARHEYGHEDGSEFLLWVDTNEDDVKDEGENYNFYLNCPTWFSNFGRWVNMVAPGQGIYSTTPVSYPFVMNFFEGVDAGYGWLDGTSQAAAFVAGGAARAWSLNAAQTNAQIKSLLIETGFDPADFYGKNQLAVDESVTEPWQAEWDDDKYNWFAGDEGNPNDDYVRAPYCYPTASDDGDATTPNPFSAAEDMSATRYLNIAAAMNRFRIYAHLRGALSGTPLDGATVQLKLGTKIVDKMLVKADRERWFSVVLNNIPYQDGGVYQYQVSRKGYTAGFQTYHQFTLNASAPEMPVPGDGWWAKYGDVSVPEANKNLHAVLDWTAMPWISELEGANLDLFLWLPEIWPPAEQPDGDGGVVNRGRLFGDYQPAYDIYPPGHPWEGWDGNLGEGTLLDSSLFGQTWETSCAQHNFERWGDDRSPTESITICTKSGLPRYAGEYTFMVTDYSSSYLDGGLSNEPDRLDIDSNQFVYPLVRLWSGGKLLATAPLTSSADSSCNDSSFDADFWKALTINGLTRTAHQQCGTAENPPAGNSIMPY